MCTLGWRAGAIVVAPVVLLCLGFEAYMSTNPSRVSMQAIVIRFLHIHNIQTEPHVKVTLLMELKERGLTPMKTSQPHHLTLREITQMAYVLNLGRF